MQTKGIRYAKTIILTLVTLLLVAPCVGADSIHSYTIRGQVFDQQTGTSLEYANIVLLQNDRMICGMMSDGNGRFVFGNLSAGTFALKISYMGYSEYHERVELKGNLQLKIQMKSEAHALNEVIVTASESRQATSSSSINQTAMKHLQPSSFSDLLELVPGGKSSDPDMGNVNTIRLREANSTKEDIASLGVGFMIDGVLQNNDADLQVMPDTYLGSGKSAVSKGVDMRTISTDNIEHVEIVRGIPSVSYGNLTGGMVIINRKSAETPVSVRFKADQKSKLFSAGKGIRLNDSGRRILNVDLSYLDSKIDPVDSKQNYSRATGSLRLNDRINYPSGAIVKWTGSVDYTGSFDHIKKDKDATVKEDAYKSNYNSLTVAGNWSVSFPENSWIRQLKAGLNVKQEWSKTEEIKSVSIDRPLAVPCSTQSGENDGIYLPYTYIADYVVDGKPLYVNAQASAQFKIPSGPLRHQIQIGTDWAYYKNNGEGQVFDMTRPLYYATTTRPRKYSQIPGLQTLSGYIEDEMNLIGGKHQLSLTCGIRFQTLLGLDRRYSLSGSVTTDPRFSLQWKLPMGKGWQVALSGGLGWMSRMPTQAQLFPDAKYVDLVELNYYSNTEANRRIYLKTYTWDNANYKLQAARNRKWELRADVSYSDNRLSMTYFRERMNNAFSKNSYYRIFDYRQYTDPTLSSWTDVSAIDTYTQIGNDEKVSKEGVEYQFTSRRLKFLNTRITVNGAWIKTLYSNLSTQYKSASVLVNNSQLQYVGIYDWEDGVAYQKFNTNVMADSYLKRLGLNVSLTAQFTWFTSTRPLWNSGMPFAYVDKDGNTHEFKSADADDAYLKHLVTLYSSSYFDRTSVPFAADFNLKATKDIGRYMTLGFFVNRILGIYPDYYRNSVLIRRSSVPYFGIEANLKL